MRLMSGLAACASTVCALSLCMGCGLSLAQSASGAPVRPQLSVAPIPTATDPSPGIPQVSWSTGNGSPGEVTVSFSGTKETLFAQGPEGTTPAPWISAGTVYVFRLYSTISRRRLLARLAVGRGEQLDVLALPQTPRMTSPVVNRVLQVLPYCILALVMLLAALYLADLRRPSKDAHRGEMRRHI
jgi:hypothetical protein